MPVHCLITYALLVPIITYTPKKQKGHISSLRFFPHLLGKLIEWKQ